MATQRLINGSGNSKSPESSPTYSKPVESKNPLQYSLLTLFLAEGRSDKPVPCEAAFPV